MIPELKIIAENVYELKIEPDAHLAETLIDVVHSHEEKTGKRERDRVLAITPARMDGGLLYGVRYANSHCEVEGRSPRCDLYHNHPRGMRSEKTIRDILGENFIINEERVARRKLGLADCIRFYTLSFFRLITGKRELNNEEGKWKLEIHIFD